MIRARAKKWKRLRNENELTVLPTFHATKRDVKFYQITLSKITGMQIPRSIKYYT
jgi:hypothetical protein